MNRKTFFKSAIALMTFPFISIKSEAKTKEFVNDRLKLGHQYPGAYHEPNDLFTPNEITESGFVFVPFPTFIHKFDDPQHPIMQSYIGYGNKLDPTDTNYFPIVCRTNMCTPSYIKTYDLDTGRKRGIESLPDYFRKKDIFKPMILEFMKKREYHYVHRIILGDSPCSWNGKFGNSDMIYHLYPVFVRGYKLPARRII